MSAYFSHLIVGVLELILNQQFPPSQHLQIIALKRPKPHQIIEQKGYDLNERLCELFSFIQNFFQNKDTSEG